MNVSRHLIGVGPPFLPLIPIKVLELTNADKRGRNSIIIKLDIQAQDSTARITIDPNELGLTFSKNKSRLNFDRLEFVDEGNNPPIPPILIKSEMVLESPKGILKLSYELDNWSMPRELAVNLNGFKCNNSVVFPDQIQFVRATRWEYIGFFIFN